LLQYDESVAYVFFAGYDRLDQERSSNMEKLGKVVRDLGKDLSEFERHELTVSFCQELDEEFTFPPKYNKQEGETYSEKLGPCARKSALMLEREMVDQIRCSNKIGGGGGKPPKYRWGCSIATTSVIILVPCSNSGSSSASDGSHGVLAAGAGPASDYFQDSTSKKRVQDQEATTTSTAASAASMNSDTGELDKPRVASKRARHKQRGDDGVAVITATGSHESRVVANNTHEVYDLVSADESVDIDGMSTDDTDW
jgi:hypothetical protein